MIPEGRLSTTLVTGLYLDPEDQQKFPLVSHERGPIAIEDTSEGLLYQNWVMTYVAGDLVAAPEDTGSPSIVLTVADIIFVSFTFDQNARITITYSTLTSSYIYWYDSSLGMTVTTDLGSDVITPSIFLDDKRDTQNGVNDMLLWYTKSEGGGTYELFMLRQRDRFLTEYSMATGLTAPYIYNLGMSSELRIQLSLYATPPRLR